VPWSNQNIRGDITLGRYHLIDASHQVVSLEILHLIEKLKAQEKSTLCVQKSQKLFLIDAGIF